MGRPILLGADAGHDHGAHGLRPDEIALCECMAVGKCTGAVRFYALIWDDRTDL